MTTGNVARAKCSIWKQNSWVCTRGWVGLMGSIDFPLQSIAATQLLKYSLLPLCSKAKNHLQCWGKDRWNNSSFCLFCSWQHRKSKLWGKKEETNKYISAKMRFVLFASGLSRTHSIFFRGIMTAVKITTLVSGNSKFSHMKWPEEIFWSLKTISLFPKGNTGVKSASRFPQVTGLNKSLSQGQ